MRNWNTQFNCVWSIQEEASRLPMRNWNSLTHRKCLRVSSFQTTYEELKLLCLIPKNLDSRLPDYLWGIETQYCVSWVRKVWLPDYLWGIETAVEYPCAGRVQLPDYLWGIETPKLRKVWRVKPRELPDYLWGIETFRRIKGLPIGRPASRLPMRNWNSTIVRSSARFELPDYLWGIETKNIFQLLYSFIYASRLPMRNWNPLHS